MNQRRHYRLALLALLVALVGTMGLATPSTTHAASPQHVHTVAALLHARDGSSLGGGSADHKEMRVAQDLITTASPAGQGPEAAGNSWGGHIGSGRVQEPHLLSAPADTPWGCCRADRVVQELSTLSDSYPCTFSTRYPSLPYICSVVWPSNGRIPIYYGTSAGSGIADYLERRTGVQQYFVCDYPGERYPPSGTPTNIWWAYTKGDVNHRWGWVPEVFLKGGGNDEPDAGLPIC